MVHTVTAVDDFLAAFFGPGNDAVPGGDLSSEVGGRLVPNVAPLRAGARTPIVLPRKQPGSGYDAYVICWDSAQAAATRALVESFVAHSYAPFDGRPHRLDPADPVDAAVLGLVGAGTTYVLRPPDSAHANGMWTARARLRDLLALRPERSAPVPRPVGRVLAEFHAALAAGNAAASGELLDELSGAGLSAVNLAYLRVHRLARLGRDVEILNLPALRDVAVSGPPQLVRDAILASWSRVRLRDVLGSGAAFDGAAAVVNRDDALLNALTRPAGAGLSNDAAVAVATVAVVRGDAALAGAVEDPDALPAVLRDRLRELLVMASDEAPAAAAAPPAVPRRWPEVVDALAEVAPADVAWQELPSPTAEDEELAAAIERVAYAVADRAWSLVGPFLNAGDLGNPAWRSARALLVLAVTYDRWAPADVAAIQALLDVFLRGAPPAAEYADIVDMLAGSADRWAAPGNALPVLDMVDDLARWPVADEGARLRFACAALEPLSRHRRRLEPEVRWLAGQLAADLAAPFEWDVPATPDDEAAPDPVTARVLLYSLDDHVLQRTAERVANLYPGVVVHQANDHVGSPQLRAHARGADVIVLATRCATHAATGFIRGHASSGAIVVEADGGGSASLMRAVARGLADAGARAR